jgi:hypothetical protein
MPMIHECERDGCSTLTMGRLCLEHEATTVLHDARPQGAAQPASVEVRTEADPGQASRPTPSRAMTGSNWFPTARARPRTARRLRAPR